MTDVVAQTFPIEGDAVVRVHTITASSDGPTVAILGGVHGDELEGVAATRLLRRWLPEALVAGRLRIVDVANPLAHAARQRRSPADDGDLARSFPGRPDGTATERIADVLTTEVIDGADLLVDLHSAGADYAMPLFAGFIDTDDEVAQRSCRATTAFAAPLSWRHHGINPGRSLSAAHALGVPAFYVEGGGGGALDLGEVTHYVRGTERILADLSMASPAPSGAPTTWLVGGDGDIDASVAATTGGWCMTAVRAGEVVEAGRLIAEILDLEGAIAERIVAPRPGTVMLVRRRAEIAAGDAVVMFGPNPT